jgi:hypothetical protein
VALVQTMVVAREQETSRWPACRSLPTTNVDGREVRRHSHCSYGPVAPGEIVAGVARHAEICAGQIYRWRQEMR